MKVILWHLHVNEMQPRSSQPYIICGAWLKVSRGQPVSRNVTTMAQTAQAFSLHIARYSQGSHFPYDWYVKSMVATSVRNVDVGSIHKGDHPTTVGRSK